MIYLYSLAFIGLGISGLTNIKKTIKALKTALSICHKMLPMLLMTVAVISFILYILPDYVIARYLGTSNQTIGVLLATLIGSVSLLPGFITFPLSGLLLEQGVSYTILAAFTTSLMMVGVVTYPIERKYFGTRLTLLRNVSSLVIAVIISMAIGLLYGEVHF